MRFDLANRIAPVRAIAPAAAITDNTPKVSQIFDTRGMMGIALVILLGALGTDAATFSVLIEESDAADMSGATPVPDNSLIGTEALAGFTGTADNGVRKIGYIGARRYLRATITPAGNAAASFIAAVWLGNPEDQPAANPPA